MFLINKLLFKAFYLMFLFLFSYVIMCNFHPIDKQKFNETTLTLPLSIPEIVLIIWVSTFFLEEIRKVFN